MTLSRALPSVIPLDCGPAKARPMPIAIARFFHFISVCYVYLAVFGGGSKSTAAQWVGAMHKN